MPAKRKVILVTDGDIYVAKAIEYAKKKKRVAAAFPNRRGIRALKQDRSL